MACTGWWTPEPVPTLRYQLRLADDQEGSNSDALVSTLTSRLHHATFLDATVSVTTDGFSVVIHDDPTRAAPLHLFQRGGFTVHRVDELQSKGADRVARQVLADAEVRSSDPPERLWSVLRDASLLPPDRLAYYSQTPDGREELLFVQTNAFLQHDLFETSQVEVSEASCHVVAQWSERLSGILSDQRLRASRQRVAIMMDGELLGFRPLEGLWHLEHPFRLDVPTDNLERGGRRIWSVTEDANTWCRDVSAVLDSGPLPFALRLGEITANSP